MTSSNCKIFHADLWGIRKDKYYTLLEADLKGVPWKTLQPTKPFYMFIPQNEEQREVYEQGWKVSDIFAVQSTGVKTHRDHFVTDFDEKALRKRIEAFRDLSIADDEIARKYALENTESWNLSKRRKSLASDKGYAGAFTRLLYRPFDTLPYFHHDDAVDRPRHEVMYHMLAGANHALIIPKQTKDDWAILATNIPAVHKAATRYDTGYYFPLYLYPPAKEENKPKSALFDEDDPFQGKKRIENLSLDFRAVVDKHYGHHYSPEEILGYIYAVLHSPTYRAKYQEFLKIDFPRIPFVDDRKTFEALSKLGWELVQAHLLKGIPKEPKVDVTKGGFEVEKPAYDEKQQRLYINKDQYFSPVPKAVWEFHLGGYQVLDKYLKSRKGRTLSLDEIENIQNIVKTLAFTILQMQKIDEGWKPRPAILETVV